jgi:hypothetical protein
MTAATDGKRQNGLGYSFVTRGAETHMFAAGSSALATTLANGCCFGDI